MRIRTAAAIVAFSVTLVAPTLARAEDAATTQTAVQLADEASELFQSGKFADALDRYEKAFALVRRPTLGVRIARCLEKLGRLNEAADRYLTVSRMALPPDLDPDKAAKQREAITQADTERTALLPRIPSVVIKLTGPATSAVTIDGQPVPRALYGLKRAADPGSHHIEARSGTDVVVKDVTLEEGSVLDVELALRIPPGAVAEHPGETSPPAPGRSTLRTAGYVGVGVGVAGLALGGVTGAMALSQKSDLERKCGSDLACGPSHKDDADAYNNLRTFSSVGFIAGGVLAATGIVLVIVSPKSVPVNAYVAPTGGGLSGTF